ncbi:MAG: HAD family hydrolase [Fimbriimonas sp.]|nr:HAD family hydrolase [Fimbriimonas sp.]
MVGSLQSVRAIYFDLDDTLCGYWNASKLGLRRTFEKYGPEGFDAEELVRHWAAAFRDFAPDLKRTDWYPGYLLTGEPTRTEQMRRMLARIGIDEPALASRLSMTYMEERDRSLELFPDAVEVLDQLRPIFPLGLITNGPADIQRQEIETLGIGTYFRHILIEGEMGEGKPAKSVFDRATSIMGCERHEILMVGNSYRHDIRAALEYGWHAIWVLRDSDVPPSASGDTLKPEALPQGAPEPDATIGSLSALLGLLGL